MTKKIVKGYCEESKCVYDVYTASTLDETKATKQTTVCITYGEQTINNTTATLTYDDAETVNIDIGAIENSVGNTITIESSSSMKVKLSTLVNFVADNNTSVTVKICKKSAEDNSVIILASDSYYIPTNDTAGKIIIPNFVTTVYNGEELFVIVTTTGNVHVQGLSYFTLETLNFHIKYEDLEGEE